MVEGTDLFDLLGTNRESSLASFAQAVHRARVFEVLFVISGKVVVVTIVAVAKEGAERADEVEEECELFNINFTGKTEFVFVGPEGTGPVADIGKVYKGEDATEGLWIEEVDVPFELGKVHRVCVLIEARREYFRQGCGDSLGKLGCGSHAAI